MSRAEVIERLAREIFDDYDEWLGCLVHEAADALKDGDIDDARATLKMALDEESPYKSRISEQLRQLLYGGDKKWILRW